MAMVSPERVLTDNLLFLRTEVIVQTTHTSYYVFIIVIYTRPGAINDPLGQNRSHASFVLLDFENECTDGRTTCTKTKIPANRDSVLAE